MYILLFDYLTRLPFHYLVCPLSFRYILHSTITLPRASSNIPLPFATFTIALPLPPFTIQSLCAPSTVPSPNAPFTILLPHAPLQFHHFVKPLRFRYLVRPLQFHYLLHPFPNTSCIDAIFGYVELTSAVYIHHNIGTWHEMMTFLAACWQQSGRADADGRKT